MSAAAGGLPRELSGAITRYRVMAWVVGTMLIILCCIAMPLQYVADKPALATVVAPLHGFLYIAYLFTVADLARRWRLRLGRIVGLVCAGFIPGLAFVVEHRTTRALRVEIAQWAGLLGPSSSASSAGTTVSS